MFVYFLKRNIFTDRTTKPFKINRVLDFSDFRKKEKEKNQKSKDFKDCISVLRWSSTYIWLDTFSSWKRTKKRQSKRTQIGHFKDMNILITL